MSSVLVTGATGLLGAFCLPKLADSGHTVHAVSRNPFESGGSGVHWHRADLFDPSAVSRLLSEIGATHLLHLAWCTEHGVYWHSLDNVRWVEASLYLVRQFLSCGGQRIVHAGTCAEYDWSQGECNETNTPLRPATMYGTCKHALRLIVERMSDNSAWARLFYLYGPKEDERRFVAHVIKSLLSGGTVECTHGRQIRDYLYVKDAAAALVALLQGQLVGPVNVASGSPVSIRDLALSIGERLDAVDRIRLDAIPAHPGEPPSITADIRRLRDEAGWTPSYSMDAAMDETIEWWRNNLSCRKS